MTTSLRSRASWQGAAMRQIEAAAGGACTFEWLEYGKDDAGRWGHCAAFGPDGARALWIVRSNNHGGDMEVKNLDGRPAAAARYCVLSVPDDGEGAALWFCYDRETRLACGHPSAAAAADHCARLTAIEAAPLAAAAARRS